jgi:hypothetical protein
MRRRSREDFNHVVNESLLETMSRSINTGLTVIIMLVVMLFLGGESIYNFILAMLIGIATGLYSSIFNASMVLTAWHNLDLKKLALAAPTGSAGRTSTQSVAPAPRANSSSASRATVPLSEDTSKASTPVAAKPAPTSLPSEQRPHKARSKRRF